MTETAPRLVASDFWFRKKMRGVQASRERSEPACRAPSCQKASAGERVNLTKQSNPFCNRAPRAGQFNEEMGHLHEEMVHVNEEAGDLNEERVHLNEEAADLNDETVHLNEETGDLNEEAGHLNEEMGDANDEVVQLNAEMNDPRGPLPDPPRAKKENKATETQSHSAASLRSAATKGGGSGFFRTGLVIRTTERGRARHHRLKFSRPPSLRLSPTHSSFSLPLR